jgi:hypothetical protein
MKRKGGQTCKKGSRRIASVLWEEDSRDLDLVQFVQFPLS